MLNIRNSSLEDVKQNPALAAQMIVDDTNTQKGSRGMLACWQTVAKKMLRKQLSTSVATQELTQSFRRFVDKPSNNKHQALLIQQLEEFEQQCSLRKFVWEDGQHQIKWELYAGVQLTGLSPVVVQDGNEFYSFIITEGLPGWENQVRFPLFQQYIADYTLHCDISELNVGVYDLSTNRFQFKKYTADELREAVHQTSDLFQQVLTYYTNFKTTTNVLR